MKDQKNYTSEELMQREARQREIRAQAIELAEKQLLANGIKDPLLSFNPAKDSHAIFYDLARDYQKMHSEFVIKNIRDIEMRSKPSNQPEIINNNYLDGYYN